MSTLWQKWGDKQYPRQTVGYGGVNSTHYIQGHCWDNGEITRIAVDPEEIDDLIYQLMRLKRKVEGE